MTSTLPHVTVHTDGACSGNPGPGGWGAILSFGDHEKELKGAEANTTNNRMELMAAISALEALKVPCRVDIHTDSQYLQQRHHVWIAGWKKRGWRIAKEAGQEFELWQRLDAAWRPHRCAGIGCAVIPGMISTSALMSWRARRSRRCAQVG